MFPRSSFLSHREGDPWLLLLHLGLLLWRQHQMPAKIKCDRSKGFVHFKKINIVYFQFSFGKNFFCRIQGPVSMIVGSVPILAVPLIFALGFRPHFSPNSRFPSKEGSVDNSRAVSCMMDVIYFLGVEISLLLLCRNQDNSPAL